MKECISNEDKYNLIIKNLQEVINEKLILDILKERDLKLYWGTASTGRIHVGYLQPFIKLAHFLIANCEVTVLIADLHAYLDSMKSSWEELNYRNEYYKLIITQVLKLLNANVDKIKFKKGTDYQLDKKYTLDVYKLMSKVTLHDATKSGAEVVKQSKNPCMSSLLYPGLQALDEEYLDVDAQFGGIDQRKIFMLADKYLPALSYKKRIHLMNKMIPSLNSSTEGKMSCSDINSKIDLLDTPKQIKKKINKSFCEEGNTTTGLFVFIEWVIFPILELKDEIFIINRGEEHGGILKFDSYSELKSAFEDNNLHPCDLKQGVSDFLINFLEPIRDIFNLEDNKELLENAYS